MEYTPRQLQSFLILAVQRRKADLRERLYIGRLAAHGDEKAVRGQLKDWDDAR